MTIKYRSKIDAIDVKKRPEFISKSGSKFVNTYEYRYIDGVKTLVPAGEKNIQDYIDSFAFDADINIIIAKFLNGDTTVINKVVGQFGDFRDCPTTYADLFDRVQKCENLFNSLPVDIKEKFDNSYEKFWSEFGSNYFDDVFKDYNSSSIDNVDSVKNIESEVVNDA